MATVIPHTELTCYISYNGYDGKYEAQHEDAVNRQYGYSSTCTKCRKLREEADRLNNIDDDDYDECPVCGAMSYHITTATCTNCGEE